MNAAQSPNATKACYDYLPALDGFRAVSILLVFISHASSAAGHIIPGGLGVTVFFVISGFLITRQMIVEVEKAGTLSLKNFYLRRVFRLAPALLVYTALFGAICVTMGYVVTPVHVLTGLFYLANYYHIFIGYPPHSPFPIIWSLSVEEHYYIVFPFLILMFRRNLKKIMPLLTALVLGVLMWRFALYAGCAHNPDWGQCGLPGHIRTQGTDAIFDCILYGAMTALVLHYWNGWSRKCLINPAAFTVAMLGLLGTLAYRDEMFRETLRYSLQSIFIAVIIVNTLFGKWVLPRDLLSLPLGIFIGRLSYSLYLFHFGLLSLVPAVRGHGEELTGTVDYILYFTLSPLFAAASYFWVEKPMIALRKRFGAHVAKTA